MDARPPNPPRHRPPNPPRRRHPAHRARQVTAVLSATAFAGIAGTLAATRAGAASSSHTATTPTTVAPDSGAPVDDGDPTGQGWTATPGGQDGSFRPVSGGGGNHGQSGAS